MIHLLEYYAMEAVLFLITPLPLPLVFYLAERLGDIAYLFMNKRRRVALSNIEKAFGNTLPGPAKKQMAKSAFQSAALSIAELFMVQKIKGELNSRFKIKGLEIVKDAFAKGKGVVITTSHLGSWEYLLFLACFTHTGEWSVVVKDIKNAYVNKTIADLRRGTTVAPIPKTKSIRTILKELKNNHGLGILIDQWAGSDGIWTPFFGTGTSTTSVPARLAKQTGCALIPAYCIRQGSGQYEIQIFPEIPLDEKDPHWERSMTEELNKQLEKQILKYPGQWLWGHRRWKDKPAFLRVV